MGDRYHVRAALGNESARHKRGYRGLPWPL